MFLFFFKEKERGLRNTHKQNHFTENRKDTMLGLLIASESGQFAGMPENLSSREVVCINELNSKTEEGPQLLFSSSFLEVFWTLSIEAFPVSRKPRPFYVFYSEACLHRFTLLCTTK